MRPIGAGAIGTMVTMAVVAGGVLALSGDVHTVDRLVVLQINVCGHVCNGGGLAVATNIETSIKARRPFAVTLNEVCETQYDSLRAHLDAYRGRFDPTGPRCRNGARYGNAILLRAAKADFVGSWELPNPAGDERRRVMCLSTRMAQAPSLLVCVTHISNEAANIADQVMAVATIANQLRVHHPMLVGGDFNTDPSDARMSPMYSTYFDSGTGAFREADAGGPASRSTLDAQMGSDVINENTYSRHKFDYIFLSDGDWDSAKAEVDGSIRLSDHSALWATATLRNSRAYGSLRQPGKRQTATSHGEILVSQTGSTTAPTGIDDMCAVASSLAALMSPRPPNPPPQPRPGRRLRRAHRSGLVGRHNLDMHEMVSESLPFRWDLVTPDQLGSLLDGTVPPSLWFLDGLIDCAGKVVARSGNGDLIFVGRSLDSMYDLLSGAFADATDRRAIHRLPFSFQRPAIGPPSARRWRRRPLTPAEKEQARGIMASIGLTPHALARRDRPATFVDVVHGGSTFTELFELLRTSISDERASWPVIRRKVRFVGVTSRVKTSPKTYRWHQHAPWTGQLPASAVVNVSLDPWIWSYFGDHQIKLTRSFRPERWLADAQGPDRDDKTRQALAEAVALVAYGRSEQGRRALARAIGREPALAQPWLRTLVTHLNKKHWLLD